MSVRRGLVLVALATLGACSPNDPHRTVAPIAATTTATIGGGSSTITVAAATDGAPRPTSSPSTNAGTSTPAPTSRGSVTPSSTGGPSPSAASTTVTPALLAGLAADPPGLARQLTDALRTVRDPAAAADAVDAAGRRQQLVLRRLAAHPDWQAAALVAVGDDVRTFAANDVAALNAPGDPSLAKPVPPLDALPAWTIRAPRPAAELLGYYRQAEAATGIPWTYLAAINLVETRMGRIVGPSSVGAQGPMQFMPATWASCCRGDPMDDRDAIAGAAQYLRRRGGPADMTRAVLGYNPNNAYLTMIQHYVANLSADERLYAGYHAWQVFVSTTAGPVRVPVGYAASAPVPAAGYVADHPDDRA